MAVSFLISPSDRELIGESLLTILADVYGAYLPSNSFEIEVSSAEPEKIRQLNRTYRSIDEPTDVLSFPTFSSEEELTSLPPEISILMGSIIICPAKVSLYGETLPQMIHHGILHLIGYDHETDFKTWHAKEIFILEKLEEAGLVIPPVISNKEND